MSLAILIGTDYNQGIGIGPGSSSFSNMATSMGRCALGKHTAGGCVRTYS